MRHHFNSTAAKWILMCAATENPKADHTENNPETGTANSFQRKEGGELPEEAGNEPGTPIADKPLADRGDLGRKPHMEQPGADGAEE